MKRCIIAFSMSNRYTFNKLADIGENVIDHLIKVFLYLENDIVKSSQVYDKIEELRLKYLNY